MKQINKYINICINKYNETSDFLSELDDHIEI